MQISTPFKYMYEKLCVVNGTGEKEKDIHVIEKLCDKCCEKCIDVLNMKKQ